MYFFHLCRVERSTDQVMKPVNTEALSKWVGHVPSDVINDMAEIAPMLARLGYDPHANPPDYTKAESTVYPFNTSQVSPRIPDNSLLFFFIEWKNVILNARWLCFFIYIF